MNFQGNEDEDYRIKHHVGDDFSWHMPRNERGRRGRYPVEYMEFWKIRLDYGGGDTARRIFWVIEPDLPGEGMELTKEPVVGQTEL